MFCIYIIAFSLYTVWTSVMMTNTSPALAKMDMVLFSMWRRKMVKNGE